MYKFHNILDYDSYLKEDWEYISKSKDGNISIKKLGDEPISVENQDDIDDINQVANRAIDDNIKKFCGGITEFEMKYGDKKIIHQLYVNETEKETPKKFDDLIDKENTFGYISLDTLNLKDPPTYELFNLHPGTIGNGEVLLPCMFPDVRLSRRTFREEQTKDCETDTYDIEIKSRGSEFYFKDYKNTNDIIKTYQTRASFVENKRNLICTPIAEYIIERYKNKPLIFICYDNDANKIPTGFFWLKYTGEEKEGEKKEALIDTIDNLVTLDGQTAQHTNKFSIVASKEKPELICYCSLFDEVKLNNIIKRLKK